MKLEKNLQYIDDYFFRCRSNSPKHDMKINFRKNSIFENIKLNINTIHYLIYNCFLENYSLDTAYTRIHNFCDILNNHKQNKHTIVRLFRILKNKIKIYYHTKRKNEPLGIEPAENGKSRIEIDESKVIVNYNSTIWMFGLIDRYNKDARVFCVMSNRTKEKLLPIVRDNVYTNDMNDETKIRIYLDSFSAHQEEDSQNIGYKLNKVNHSLWFGIGLFHTKTIEGLCGKIKRFSNNFAGLNYLYYLNIEKEGIQSEYYIHDWLCYYLFLQYLKR